MPLHTCVLLPNLLVLAQTVRALLIRPAWQIWPLASRLSRSLKVIGTDMDRSATYDFQLTFHSSLSRTNSEINDDFSWKSQFLSPSVYLTPRWMGCPCNWVSAHLGTKKLESLCWGADKEVRRCLQPSGYNTRTWQTDEYRLTANTALMHSVAR